MSWTAPLAEDLDLTGTERARFNDRRTEAAGICADAGAIEAYMPDADYPRVFERNGDAEPRSGTKPDDDDTACARLSRSLAQILRDPDALKPPEALYHRIAYRQRVTLLVAAPKAGKSTLVRAALAAAARERVFLDGPQPTRRMRALYAALEGATADAARSLVRFGGAGGGADEEIFVLERLPRGFDDLWEEVVNVDPDVVVIDTLAVYTEGRIRDASNDSAGWTTVMRELADLARARNVAIVLVHHGRKADGRSRDSSAIEAGVDLVLSMSELEGDPTLRHIQARGRWEARDFDVRLGPDVQPGTEAYALVSGHDLSPDAKAIAFVVANPGIHKTAVLEAMGVRKELATVEFGRLLRSGTLVNKGTESKYALYVGDAPRVKRLDPQFPIRETDGVGPASGPSSQARSQQVRPLPDVVPAGSGVQAGSRVATYSVATGPSTPGNHPAESYEIAERRELESDA